MCGSTWANCNNWGTGVCPSLPLAPELSWGDPSSYVEYWRTKGWGRVQGETQRGRRGKEWLQGILQLRVDFWKSRWAQSPVPIHPWVVSDQNRHMVQTRRKLAGLFWMRRKVLNSAVLLCSRWRFPNFKRGLLNIWKGENVVAAHSGKNTLRRTMQIVECCLLHRQAQGRVSS